ncbi:3-oxoacyl-ACP synthase III family protein [Catenulispora rubra]|uniref:3-oxoacyl-ACP synthase III family protein n=1 Tax=Catenulispora rubra TaxID=280293 RepID=UPI002B27749B|nr:ketoacyl-ACP synthase III [Catenulispora rubra]
MSAVTDGHNAPATVLGTGSYLPERIVTNKEIEACVPDASAEWIERRTGILERRYAAPEQAASDLAVHAARGALADSGLDAGDLDHIIVATTTGDAPIPATAALVQRALGARRAACFDINAACTGFITGLSVARGCVALDPAAKVLVIGADVWSRFVDFGDRATSVLFGDGAGAVVVGGIGAGSGPALADGDVDADRADAERADAERGGIGAPRGLLGVELASHGDVHELIGLPAGGSRRPPSAQTLAEGGHTLRMQGRAVRGFVLDNVPDLLAGLLNRCGHKPCDVDHFVPHQANGVLVAELAEAGGLAGAQTHLSLRHSGNIGAASVPVALDQANRSGAVRDGDLVLLAGFGAGMSAGAALLRWTVTAGGPR